MLFSLQEVAVNAECVCQSLDHKDGKHQGKEDLEWARKSAEEPKNSEHGV
jgi:hypothetical protein